MKNENKQSEKDKLMVSIAKEGHSFPHYWTCKTCEDDFDMVADFGRKQALASAIAEIDKPETIDVFSDLIHKEWESWSQNTAKGLHDVKVSCYEGNTREAIQKINTMINRWEHNWRPYNDLLEEIKEQDRIWARKVIEALKSRLEAKG